MLPMGVGKIKVTERTAKGLRKQFVEELSNHLVREADARRLRCRLAFLRRRGFQRGWLLLLP